MLTGEQSLLLRYADEERLRVRPLSQRIQRFGKEVAIHARTRLCNGALGLFSYYTI